MRELGGLTFIEKCIVENEARRIKKNACWALSYLPNIGIPSLLSLFFY